jgi:hypothetical protein
VEEVVVVEDAERRERRGVEERRLCWSSSPSPSSPSLSFLLRFRFLQRRARAKKELLLRQVQRH